MRRDHKGEAVKRKSKAPGSRWRSHGAKKTVVLLLGWRLFGGFSCGSSFLGPRHFDLCDHGLRRFKHPRTRNFDIFEAQRLAAFEARNIEIESCRQGARRG